MATGRTGAAQVRQAWRAATHRPLERHAGCPLEGDRAGARLLVPGCLGRPDLPHDSRADRRGYRRERRLVEHRFVVLCYDRKTGKLLWERVAKTDTPHEPHHPTYGSFASNSPITDGKHVYAFFGSRGLHAFTIDGQPVWQKDFGQLRMFMTFGEGAWTWLEGDTLLVVVDHEGESFLVALDKATGKERWRTPRQGNTNWSGPYVTTVNGRKQVIVSASRESRRRTTSRPGSESGGRADWDRTPSRSRLPPTASCS